MFEPRPKEPDYAFVPQVPHPEQNCWGESIETVPPEGDADVTDTGVRRILAS